jgi:proteasome lid subunit RPN8/RPN11
VCTIDSEETEGEFLVIDKLVISKKLLEEIISYCKDASPNEACGILAGRNHEVIKVYKMTNIENSPISYTMDSREQFSAMKDMRENNLSMIAIFHSHPLSPAYPSKKDMELAFYEDSAYVIVSLFNLKPVVKAFSIKEKKVEEIEIVVMNVKDGQ